MSRKVQERDRTAIPFWDLNAGWQILRHRILECDFALSDHVSEQECRESFGHRANLKTSVAIQGLRVRLVEMTVRDNPSALRSDNADYDSDTIFLAGECVDPFGEHLANISIRRE